MFVLLVSFSANSSTNHYCHPSWITLSSYWSSIGS